MHTKARYKVMYRLLVSLSLSLSLCKYRAIQCFTEEKTENIFQKKRHFTMSLNKKH